ncbi:MAG: FHA domain-containing protein [Chloroflexi bacterium]|nr:FHA domain-containing protein [Chloroflexota bacterium]
MLGRVLFLAALYLFLLVLALLLRRELRLRASRSDERAPGDLLVVDPYETGLEAGERIPLLALATIGRDNDNDVILTDTFVSAEHAKLSWNGRGWVLEDLGSTNGTRVNGKPVHRSTPIKPGDTIEFGRVKTRLVPL